MNKAFEKILDRLEEMRKKSCIPNIKGYCQTTISRAEKIVLEVAEEYTSTDGWIPCSERLPEEKDVFDKIKKMKTAGNINEIGNDEKMRNKQMKCNICGNEFIPNRKNNYIVTDKNIITNTDTMYDATDCNICGAQIIIKRRLPKTHNLIIKK